MDKRIETYVEETLARLAADDATKLRFKADLMGHILDGAQTEDISTVLQRMGSPKEMAEEINSTLYPERNELTRELTQELFRSRSENMELKKSYYEYKSKKTLFGLPLVHVNSSNRMQYARKPRVAKGIIAIGDVALGVLSIGGIAVGVVSIGAISAGLLAFGAISLGVVAALGGIAMGGVALGGVAIGYLAFGGAAVGVYAFGGAAFASQVAIGGHASGHVAIGGTAVGEFRIATSELIDSSVPRAIRSVGSSSFDAHLVSRQAAENLILQGCPNIPAFILRLLLLPFGRLG